MTFKELAERLEALEQEAKIAAARDQGRSLAIEMLSGRLDMLATNVDALAQVCLKVLKRLPKERDGEAVDSEGTGSL